MTNSKTCCFDSISTLCLLLAMFAIFDAWNNVRNSPGVDYYQFWVIAQELDQGDSDIYSELAGLDIGSRQYRKTLSLPSNNRQRRAAQFRQQLEIYSTPFLYTFFQWVTSGDYEQDHSLFQLVSLSMTVMSIIVLCRCLAFQPSMISLAIVLFVVWFEPFQSDQRVGNVNQLQLGMLSAFLWLQHRINISARNFIAGLLLGFLGMFKPNLAPVIIALCLIWLLNRRHRKLYQVIGGIAVATVIAFVASSISFGTFSCWNDWLIKVRQLAAESDVIPVAAGNFSLVQVLEELSGRNLTIPFLLIFGGATVATFWKSRLQLNEQSQKTVKSDVSRARELNEDFLAIGIGVSIMLLVSQLAWYHYFVLLVPLILYLMKTSSPSSINSSSAGTFCRIGTLACLILFSQLPLILFATLNSALSIAIPACLGSLLCLVMALLACKALESENSDV